MDYNGRSADGIQIVTCAFVLVANIQNGPACHVRMQGTECTILTNVRCGCATHNEYQADTLIRDSRTLTVEMQPQ